MNQYWEDVQTLRHQGVQVGDYIDISPAMRGLGALAGRKSMQRAAAMVEDKAKQAQAIKARVDGELNKAFAVQQAVNDALSRAQSALSDAQNYAYDVDSPTVLRVVERLETAVAQLEDLAVKTEAAVSGLHQVAVPSKDPVTTGDMVADDVVMNEWLALGAALGISNTYGVQAAGNVVPLSDITAAKSKASSLLSQVMQGLKQVQTTYTAALKTKQDAERRELLRQQQEQARENARLAQEQQLEAWRTQQQLALEQATFQAQMPAPPPAPVYTPAPSYYAPQPAQYAPGTDSYWGTPTGYTYASPQPAAPVRYAEQPSQWNFDAQAYQTPQPQSGWDTLFPGWTTVEYGAMQQGEGNYLWGLRGGNGKLGAIIGTSGGGSGSKPVLAPSGVKTAPTGGFAPGAVSGGEPGVLSAARGTANEAQLAQRYGRNSAPGNEASWFSEAGTAVREALPSLLNLASSIAPQFFPSQAAPPPPPAQPSVLETGLKVAAVVGVGAGALWAANKLMGSGGVSGVARPRRAARRRVRR